MKLNLELVKLILEHVEALDDRTCTQRYVDLADVLAKSSPTSVESCKSGSSVKVVFDHDSGLYFRDDEYDKSETARCLDESTARKVLELPAVSEPESVYDRVEVAYHVAMLRDAGFLKCWSPESTLVYDQSLTWEGHQILQNLRDGWYKAT